ncbi:hypothetical protein CDD81_1283 [Ophiocordyceps australis]|uniref:Glucose-methanol-choline oxidoreductase N-terminal domain-containing protein n=1 Tax=Ophiocordyceps australis TaxID=1399860 RepID=A0A2C5XU02_9HYPO|nr:hypothetical protein CDD81_1283 [Ophiocordyceps australis]
MAPPTRPRVSTASAFVGQQFDFLVVGGGTAGLAVAARLAQAEPPLTVGVLEAGGEAHGEHDIDIPGLFGRSLGSQHDWAFETEPQPGLNGRRLAWPRGRVLGGTSALNFMAWTRAGKQDYDAWEALGNKAWGWNDLLPFFTKSETFEPSSGALQREHDISPLDDTVLGTSGPICVYRTDFQASHALWHPTLNALGVETNLCHVGGSNVGVWTNLHAIDPATQTRCSSTRYCHDQPPNLHILTQASVSEILLQQNGPDYRATGVRFVCNGDEYVVSARQEVIVSAGTIMSPQLLELSGIGNANVLAKAGVPLKVNSPTVGENLQDHLMCEFIFEVDPSLDNLDDVKLDEARAKAAVQLWTRERKGPLTVMPCSFAYIPLHHAVPAPVLADMHARAGCLTGFDADKRQVLRDRYSGTANLGQMEYIFDLGNWSPFFKGEAGKKYGTLLQLQQHPNAVGSIHIQPSPSGKPSIEQKPLIDPCYYHGPNGQLDLYIMEQCAQFAQRIVSTQPLASLIKAPAAPSASTLNDPSKLRQWIIDNSVTDWHPVGTCSMGGRAGIEAGVVDERLRVYGVPNLRVVDASIMPLHISTHPQATVYAIAEKAAHMILEDMGR